MNLLVFSAVIVKKIRQLSMLYIIEKSKGYLIISSCVPRWNNFQFCPPERSLCAKARYVV